MICKICKLERDINDFFGKEICYKCEYKRKLKDVKNHRYCKICKTKLPVGKWCYCSKECAKEGKKRHVYWTTELKGMYKWSDNNTFFQRKINKIDDI
jgi:hypothetical protein